MSDKVEIVNEQQVSASVSNTSDRKGDFTIEVNSLEEQEKQLLQLDGADDEALKYALQAKGLVLTPEANKRINRKLFTYVVPLMGLSYMTSFLDRSTNGYAAIMGLREDLKMEGDMYSWTSTCFFLGYLLWAFPGAYSLQKFPLAKSIAAYIFLWGLTLALHSCCFTYGSFVAARTFLGIFESPLLPGLSLMTSQFFPKEMGSVITTYYFAGTGLGNILGACTAYGIEKHKDTFSLTPWRFLFLIIGIFTMILAVLFAVFIPDVPTKAWWLSEEDRLLTLERIRGNEKGFGSKKFKWYQAKEAMLDPRTHMYAGLVVAIEFSNSGITSFGSIILHSIFPDTAEALLYKFGTGLVQLFGLGLLGFANHMKLIKHPLVVAIVGICLATTGGGLLAFGPTKYSGLAGFYMIGFSPIAMITALSGLSINTGGRSKAVVANAWYTILFSASSAAGPQTFISSEAPVYRTAKICCVAFYACALVLIVILLIYNSRTNAKRDAERAALGDRYIKTENSEFLDLTDRENRDFRYVW